MRYTTTVDIWSLSQTQIRKLQPGQWVEGGGELGRYWGTKPSGTVVVAWYQNARRAGYKKYNQTLRDFALNG
jgi:hypothetical protein